jgi:hypothetical protein
MKIKELFNKSLLNEMANFTEKDTGIKYPIWLGDTDNRHGPRVKISNIPGKMTNDCFSMTISQTPEVPIGQKKNVNISQSNINKIKLWIVLNYDLLMDAYFALKRGESTIEYDFGTETQENINLINIKNLNLYLHKIK